MLRGLLTVFAGLAAIQSAKGTSKIPEALQSRLAKIYKDYDTELFRLSTTEKEIAALGVLLHESKNTSPEDLDDFNTRILPSLSDYAQQAIEKINDNWNKASKPEAMPSKWIMTFMPTADALPTEQAATHHDVLPPKPAPVHHQESKASEVLELRDLFFEGARGNAEKAAQAIAMVQTGKGIVGTDGFGFHLLHYAIGVGDVAMVAETIEACQKMNFDINGILTPPGWKFRVETTPEPKTLVEFIQMDEYQKKDYATQNQMIELVKMFELVRAATPASTLVSAGGAFYRHAMDNPDQKFEPLAAEKNQQDPDAMPGLEPKSL